MDTDEWSRRRREAAGAHAEALDRRRRADARRAQEMLDGFAAAAAAAGLPAEALRVQGYGGRGSARTDTTGWYLRADRTVAVGTDGSFYVLTARLSVTDRVRGVTLRPAEPPLVIGSGGKDGDSIDLATALGRLLPGWDARD